MFSIGEFARFGNVSVRTLHHYEEVGLLLPAAVDPHNGYRHYRAHQLPRLHRILVLKDLGLSLREIAPLLDELDDDALRSLLLDKRTQLAAQVDNDQLRLARVELRLRHIDEETIPSSDIIVKHVPAQRVATIATAAASDFDGIEATVADPMAELPRKLAALGVRARGTMLFFYVEQRDGSIVPNVAIEIGDQELPSDIAVTVVELPEVEVVATIVRDPSGHDDVGPVYGQLARWAEDHGYAVRGPGRDLILGQRESEHDEVLLEVQLPVTAD